ncbi:hypothetical protein A6046_05155 [[Haemophilus] ducreyi]|nr:hypothetical protein [[Haemophilus] ducreyi]AKO30550.1 hypothetical protein RY60_01950 [[Haemophilus] ducreyi]AKO31987.1 hypothetical protein RZ57_01955 [[Haemophilus] ducreyi]AKO33442.1 hypothetical protein RZ58_01955 [[Haemophilus] ducreyi]AKO34889.1 hypothetical protein RZ59_01940 [[Haemophilus] ducreyi]AKO36314.1 hypothetical protein RZ61_01925 [[Haemophilus] ducreyi]
MKLCKCPICHSDLTLEALIEDDSGRELLNTITNMSHGCGRAAVAYLGLFKPVKSSLSNSRSLKLLQSLLEIYPPSNVLEKALIDTVEQVRRNRRESGRIEPLTNHNYLKKVYESVKVQFAVVRSDKDFKQHKHESPEQQQRNEEDKLRGAIQYVERMRRLGQLDSIKNTESYQLWLKWQEEKANATAN